MRVVQTKQSQHSWSQNTSNFAHRNDVATMGISIFGDSPSVKVKLQVNNKDMNKRKVSVPKWVDMEILDRMEQTLTQIAAAELPERMKRLEDGFAEIFELQSRVSKLEQSIWLTKNVLTSKEAAEYLGIAESYLYKLTSQKAIPHSKPNGGMLRFDRKELELWAMNNPVIMATDNNGQH